MIHLSELQSDIKNLELICPFCFKFHLNNERIIENLSIYIDLLKEIYNENPKCSIKLNNNCLNIGSIWCTGCLNWICQNCSIKTHTCCIYNNIYYQIIKINRHRPSKVYLNKNILNTNFICLYHYRPYLFYCDVHGFLCEECDYCDLPRDKLKYYYSHGNCYFYPILKFKWQSQIKILKEKINEGINFFNMHIFKLYNDNKNKYKNAKRKRFNHHFKIYKKKFISFLEFILLLIKSFNKIIVFQIPILEYIEQYSFEFNNFEYNKNIKNKSLNNYNSQLSNYFATKCFCIKTNNIYEIENKEENVDLSQYNLKLILKNFTLCDNKNSWTIKISEKEFMFKRLLEFNENNYILFDKEDLKYKNILREIFFEENNIMEFYHILRHEKGKIFLQINDFFCIMEEINQKNKEKNIYKIVYLEKDSNLVNLGELQDIILINNNSVALIFKYIVIILSTLYPYPILKKIIFDDFDEYCDYHIKISFLSYNPNIFIIFNNTSFSMQIYSKDNYQLISNIKGIFGDEILEINSEIILITYFSYEENIYLMFIVDINNLKVLNCVSYEYYYSHEQEQFRLLKNQNFYLYSNQMEYLAINYPKFIKNNYFIKKDGQVKYYNGCVSYITLLKNDILAYVGYKGLIIESKNIIIPEVIKFCKTEDNNILITIFKEIENSNFINKLKVIKLNENGYETINSIVVKSIKDIIKISNNKFITIDYGNVIRLLKLNINNSLEYLSEKYLGFNKEIEEILVLNNYIIIPNYKDEYLNFWKINEDNTIYRIFNTNLRNLSNYFNIDSLFQYDNILFISDRYNILLMNINNNQFVKQINNLKGLCCITRTLNGNILFGIKGNEGYDIIEYKFDKNTFNLTELKLISNAHVYYISQIIEMKNGNIISLESRYRSSLIVIWNRKENNNF